MPDEARPQLLFAFFCQAALLEPDGQLSTVRILRGWEQAGPHGGDRPYFTIAPQIVVGFAYAGEGTHRLSIEPVAPSGFHRDAGPPMTVVFERGSLLSYVSAQYLIQVEEQGLHWFEVRLDGELYTRIPLLIRYKAEAQEPQLPLGTHWSGPKGN